MRAKKEVEVVLHPVPHTIKVGAAGLLLLLIASIVWYIRSSDDKESQRQDQAHSIIEIESPAQNQSSEIPVSKSVTPLKKINQPARLSDETLSPDAKLNKQTELKLSQLEQQLQQLSSKNKNRQQAQDQLSVDLQSQLTEQNIKIQQLQDNLKARQLAAKVSTKKKAVAKRYKKIIPPFTLVSIDQWGNDLYAVVRSQGQLHELTQGQTVDGWTVDSFDRSRNAVFFKNKAGTRKALLIKS